MADELRKSFRDGKKYYKTEYQSHCEDDKSQCPDHCRKFGLSDPNDPDFQEHCAHQHLLTCPQCDDITSCLEKVYQIIKAGETLSFYSDEQQDDLLYDVKRASDAIKEWKAHIMRSVNQECAKKDIIGKLDQTSCFLIIDWAVKFLQLRYREKQSDWYGKRELSWHISSVITRSQSNTTEVISYAHLFDQCTQDWYAVTSILENLLEHLKVRNPLLQKVYLRSDESRCYHNNLLIAAMKDVGKRVGVAVDSYHYSEPQSGKDICDRILCPMKTSICTYCNEGHDVLTAVDMRDSLTKHPAKGTTAAISVVNESRNTLSVHKIEQFSSFHNFRYESSGLRVWKSYGIGKEKPISHDDIYTKHQTPTMLLIPESQGFMIIPGSAKSRIAQKHARRSKIRHNCSNPLYMGALMLSRPLSKHIFSKLNQFDAIRRDWAQKFASVDIGYSKACSSNSTKLQTSEVPATASLSLHQGWALSKPRSNARFSENVREYLTALFTLGERTGQKADPTQVAAGMRIANKESNERLFSREEWLTKTQVQSFFSRLAVKRRQGQGVIDLSDEQDEDVQCLQRAF
ncbi:Hypothetical predicted protein [Paramuricea clavata]|uniref:Uncharacterized protein n=1 Tax=Paramuricea clavata TaxID=317549 RepID=A0A6S7HWF6_PARCT|nr:Hypothetical predicted protein [Paramuricea clavata]